jgi:glycosyltransferase involved in cell wall biosynthesis
MNQPRVLLSAYYCAPGGGSVSQIGWEWYGRLSREIPVTLVTHCRNRKFLEAAGAPFGESSITYIDTEWFAGPLYRLATFLFKRSEHAVFLLCSLDFFLFDFIAIRCFRKCRMDFDLVHAVTPVSPLAVTRFHKLHLPLIVGPWNGGVSTLSGFSEIMRADSEWLYGVRILRGLLDRLTGCTKKAQRILTATAATDRSLPPGTATERMVENGVDLDFFSPGVVAPPSPKTPLQILFVGRLIPAKGVSMLLAAAARIKDKIPVRVVIAGDGAIRGELERQITLEGLEEVARLLGSRTRAEIADLMRQSHALCLPSVRESGGAVLLEGMGCALPLVAVANGGPGELVDEEVGRALNPDGPEALIQGLADAFIDMYRHPGDWRQRGLNGRRRAERQYGWPARVQKIMDLYQTVLEEQDEFAKSRQSRSQREAFATSKHSD